MALDGCVCVLLVDVMSPYDEVLRVIGEVLPRVRSHPNFPVFQDHLIHGWLRQGYDARADIIPTIRMIVAKKKDISHIRYFDEPIAEAYRRRKESEPTYPPGSPASDELKARRIAHIREKCKNINMPAEFAWLAQYEAVHGPVAV